MALIRARAFTIRNQADAIARVTTAGWREGTTKASGPVARRAESAPGFGVPGGRYRTVTLSGPSELAPVPKG